jgi:hypothetical protein
MILSTSKRSLAAPFGLNATCGVLVQAERVLPKRIKQWTFYRRDEDRIRAVKADLVANL